MFSVFLPHWVFAGCLEKPKHHYWVDPYSNPPQCEKISESEFEKKANFTFLTDLILNVNPQKLAWDGNQKPCSPTSSILSSSSKLEDFIEETEEYLDKEAYKYLDSKEIPEHYFEWFEQLEKFKTIDEAYLHLKDDKTKGEAVKSALLKKLRALKKLQNKAVTKVGSALNKLKKTLPGSPPESIDDGPELVKLKSLIPGDDYKMMVVTLQRALPI